MYDINTDISNSLNIKDRDSSFEIRLFHTFMLYRQYNMGDLSFTKTFS